MNISLRDGEVLGVGRQHLTQGQQVLAGLEWLAPNRAAGNEDEHGNIHQHHKRLHSANPMGGPGRGAGTQRHAMTCSPLLRKWYEIFPHIA